MPGENIMESSGLLRKRILFRVPIVAFLVIGIFLGIGLTLNPREVPSPLVGKPVPDFDLPPVKGRNLGLATANLKQEVSLVNVFASWCGLASFTPFRLRMRPRGFGIAP
jgi:cytochrome c biogenesis protein CcmG/thiol:disulfide interchange protein DsbE